MNPINTQQLQQNDKTAYSEKRTVNFPSLNQETRSHVDTACAAFHLNRAPQTLRLWASLKVGALQPRKVHGRLSWSVSQIRDLLNGDAK